MATFTIRGHKVRTSSTRRYVVWVGRDTDLPERKMVGVKDGQPVYQDTGRILRAFKPEIVRRSDSAETAIRAAYCPKGGWVAIVDTVTGEEVGA